MMDLKKKIDDDSDETDPQLTGSLLTPDLIHAMQWMCLVISWVNRDRFTRQQQNMYWDIYEAQLDMA